jgi:hypothetical protein
MDKWTFLLGLSFLCAWSPCGTPAPAAETQPPYRVIFNCDGHAVFKDASGDLDRWIQNLFGPLENGHVDALFWCDGAGGNTANYDSRVLELTGERIGKVDPHLKRMIAEGNDPPKVVVREAKKRGIDVFYSFRINDIHDALRPPADSVELPTFKVANPEWLIGEKRYGNVTSFSTALNFAVQEVRDLKFRVIEEIFQKYDFDGLEIDFLRSPPYFLPGQEPDNAPILTQFLKRVRKHLDRCALERGRPVPLAVRVDESLEACRLDGFDVPEWLEEGLIDYLILGSGVIDIEVEEFKRLAEPAQVPVYPCLYGWPSKYSPIPRRLAAGLALVYWNQGADGIYLFNWFPHARNNSEASGAYMTELLKQLGDPDTVRANQRQLMFAADRGRPHKEYPHNWMHCVLPAELPDGSGLDVPIRVGEDFRKAPAAPSITLRLEVEHLQAGDVLEVTLNGEPVHGLQPDGTQVLTAPLKPIQLKQGRNQVTLGVAERSPKSAAARTVTALEIHVTFPTVVP